MPAAGIWLAMHSTGEESLYAVPSGVIVLRAAGPEVTTQTPGRPEARA